MLISEAFPHVKAYTINDTGVGICIVNNDIMSSDQSVDGRNHSLITEIQKIS